MSECWGLAVLCTSTCHFFGMAALSDCGSPSFRRGRRGVPSGLGVLGPDGNLHGRGSFFGNGNRAATNSGVTGLVSLLALLLVALLLVALLFFALLLVALHLGLLLPPSCCNQGRVCVASLTGVQKLDVGGADVGDGAGAGTGDSLSTGFGASATCDTDSSALLSAFSSCGFGCGGGPSVKHMWQIQVVAPIPGVPPSAFLAQQPGPTPQLHLSHVMRRFGFWPQLHKQ